MQSESMHHPHEVKTGNWAIDVMLVLLAFVFPYIYDFSIAFMAIPIRAFFVESREIILWVTAILVLLKVARDLYLSFKNKPKNNDRNE